MADQPETLTIMLRKPVSLGEGPAAVTYDHLDLREPTAQEMTTWDKLSGTEADIQAVAVVSGLPRPAVEKIGVRDLMQAARFIGGFLG